MSPSRLYLLKAMVCGCAGARCGGRPSTSGSPTWGRSPNLRSLLDVLRPQVFGGRVPQGKRVDTRKSVSDPAVPG